MIETPIPEDDAHIFRVERSGYVPERAAVLIRNGIIWWVKPANSLTAEDMAAMQAGDVLNLNPKDYEHIKVRMKQLEKGIPVQ